MSTCPTGGERWARKLIATFALALASSTLVAGCGGPSPTSAPSADLTEAGASPSPSSSAHASTPAPSSPGSGSPSPTLVAAPTPTSPLPGTLAASLAPGALRTITVPAELVPHPAGAPTGPYVYRGAESLEPTATALAVADLGGGSQRIVSVPLRQSEAIDAVLSDGRWLVVTAWRWEPLGALVSRCHHAVGTRVSWRILAVRIGADGLPAGTWRAPDLVPNQVVDGLRAPIVRLSVS